MHDETRIREIDDKLVDAVIHLIVDKVYFPKEPPGKKDGK